MISLHTLRMQRVVPRILLSLPLVMATQVRAQAIGTQILPSPAYNYYNTYCNAVKTVSNQLSSALATYQAVLGNIQNAVPTSAPYDITSEANVVKGCTTIAPLITELIAGQAQVNTCAWQQGLNIVANCQIGDPDSPTVLPAQDPGGLILKYGVQFLYVPDGKGGTAVQLQFNQSMPCNHINGTINGTYSVAVKHGVAFQATFFPNGTTIYTAIGPQ